ncbi:MAG: DUF1624 domain-containing protein [Bradyrhizobium sp.]|nr:MAG: DUF1624 domain-containing protein [Bradyrhizobium sp.]
MAAGAETDEPIKLPRIAAVDVARGVALIGMVAYHLTWDLAHFGLVAPSLPFEPATRILSHTVASAFLALVGVSLALAHPRGLNAPAFWRRLAIVAGAAALVTAASYVIDPAEPILFGILHCIAVASLIGALFVAAPFWAPLLIGAMAVVEPLVFSNEVFNTPALLWLGLGTVSPATLDWRPLLPWGGAVLIGLGLARAALPRLAQWRLSAWRPAGAPGGALVFAGRHSLAIYLIHQPILFGFLSLVVATGVFAERQARETYLAACPAACAAHGGDAQICAKACVCVVKRAGAAGLSLDAAERAKDSDTRQQLRDIVETCSLEAR